MKTELEELTNELIAAIWPVLDTGLSKDAVMSCVHNAIDSWTPSKEEP